MHKAIAFFVCLLLFGCNTKAAKSAAPMQLSEFAYEYALRLSTVTPFSSDEEILSIIDYMDNIIVSGNTEILSIYYDKARLLYKIKRYDDAVETMKQPEQGFYKFYLATLLLRIGRENEGRDMLNEIIASNYIELEHLQKKEQQRKSGFIYGLEDMYLLSDKPIESLFTELVDKKIITQQEANEYLKNYTSITKEEVLNSLWPD